MERSPDPALYSSEYYKINAIWCNILITLPLLSKYISIFYLVSDLIEMFKLVKK